MPCFYVVALAVGSAVGALILSLLEERVRGRISTETMQGRPGKGRPLACRAGEETAFPTTRQRRRHKIPLPVPRAAGKRELDILRKISPG